MLLFKDLHKMVAQEILKKASGETVLDVGTGPGYLPVKIAQLNTNANVLCLDISRDMIKIAWNNVKRANVENVQVIVGDVKNIGLATQSVDFMVATMTLHHWTDPVEALFELSRVLRHGGEILIYELDPDPTPRSKVWMKQNYSMFLRFALRIVRGHSITVEDAQKIMSSLKNEYAECRVEQLERPLIKMTLIKS